MTALDDLARALDPFPRVAVAHTPTPVEPLSHLGRELGIDLHVKRDDCTGVGLGGNKIRQLEFYLGAALKEGADTLLITGAVQSNYVRAAAAMARRFGMDCHLQLERRVPNESDLYLNNGSVLLDRLLGATLHSFPVGEDEEGADNAVNTVAAELTAGGRRPYVIPLGPGHKPLGALGYVRAAMEVYGQWEALGGFDEIFVASGSGYTHSGLLFGLRALGLDVPVTGICVRREAGPQTKRIATRLEGLAALTGLASRASNTDIRVDDCALPPGYGQLGAHTIDAVRRAADTEGLFVDPVYTGKTLAGLIEHAGSGRLQDRKVLFWHTGGLPALFAYEDQLRSHLGATDAP